MLGIQGHVEMHESSWYIKHEDGQYIPFKLATSTQTIFLLASLNAMDSCCHSYQFIKSRKTHTLRNKVKKTGYWTFKKKRMCTCCYIHINQSINQWWNFATNVGMFRGCAIKLDLVYWSISNKPSMENSQLWHVHTGIPQTKFWLGRNSNDRLMTMAGTMNLQLNCGLKHSGNPVTLEFAKLRLC
jgi:hypothetical protein